jgi:WD40 repeat protein
VPQPRVDQRELTFSARGNSPLASLADEQTLGRWQLTLVDRRSGEAGVLSSWGLEFGTAALWRDAPEQGAPLPDPTRTEQVDIVLSSAGRVAIAQPTRMGSVGSLAVWDLRSGRLVNDLHARSQAPEHVVVSADEQRVLAMARNEATLWAMDSAAPVVELTTDTTFALPPALSSDGGFVVIAETIPEDAPLFSLLDMSTGELLGSFNGIAAAREWVLGPRASFLAVIDGAGRVIVLDPHTASARTELGHSQDVVRLLPTAIEGTLVTVDADGALHGWQIDLSDTARVVGDSWLIGTTTDPASVSVADDADGIAYALGDGLVVVQDVHGSRQAQYFRAAGGTTSMTRLSPRADRLVTASGALLRSWNVEAQTTLASADRDLSTSALDRGGQVAVFGFRGGHVQAESIDELKHPRANLESINYIGHRGVVTSLAVNAAHNIIASGGSDGVVRVWNMATGAPSSQFLRHPEGPVRALDLSADGNFVMSAAEYSARVWQSQSGELVGEIPVDGAGLAVALSENADLVAVGDTAGNIFFGPPSGPALQSARADAAVMALAMSRDGTLMVSGDVAGNLQLWESSAAHTARASYLFPDAVSWVAFGSASDRVYAQSGAWVHELVVIPDGFAVVASRLLPIRLGPDPVATIMGDGGLRMLPGPAMGDATYVDLTLAASSTAPQDSGSPLLERNWTDILGLDLDRSTGAVRITRR